MEFMTQIKKGGRITLPSRMRKALQIETGDDVILRLTENGVQIIPMQRAVRLAQAKVKQYVPEGISLVDELLQSRHEETINE